ncbi:MAG: endopeptidase La [Bacteroidales bacterium]|nr:endopeptidase La [Bacteroidales bacterium]
MFEDLIFGSDKKDNNSDIFPIISDPDNILINDSDLPEELPLMTLRNSVLFPKIIIPIAVGRKKSLKLVKTAFKKEQLIGIISQKDEKIEDPDFDDIFETGTLARVVKLFEMPDGEQTAVLHGIKRFKIKKRIKTKPNLTVAYEVLENIEPDKSEKKEYDAKLFSIKELSVKIIHLSVNIPKEATFAVKNIDNPEFLINFVSSNSDINTKNKQTLLEENSMSERAGELIKFLVKEVQKLELKDNIQNKAKTEMTQQQKEYFLHQQMKAIQEELGHESPKVEIEELEKKAKKKKWNEEVAKAFKKQISRLKQINPMSPDYSYQIAYAQTLVELPWNEFTKDNFDLKRAEKILNEDHFGLDQVKDRILEHLAVLKLKGDLKAPILCLYGPPGVGKTSLGKSVARALDRKYARMSLGGLHDEAEIRGHRKTYIGAMPGRIIQNLKKLKSSNPVFILDEIDKIGNDHRGDPSSALLEVLDPEQNNTFYDNYLELEYDLSKVLFIATANSLSSIKPALRDRMELIDVSGYIIEEKIEIAKRHLIPRQLKEHGVKLSQVKLTKQAIEEIITNYTRESGVRNLEKKIAGVIRKVAKKIATEEYYNKNLKPEDIRKYLGVAKFTKNKYEGNEYAGVVTGLAWTSVGGKILYIESSASKGNGKLNLTGNLGQVMKESAIIAHEYIKAHADNLNINCDIFKEYNVHVHVPEGATPKDGPSAGVTMVTSIASTFTQRKIKNKLAMTGEITLRGKVLPVGGIKEKILAAKRADIKEIILSADNKKDIEEINEIYIKGLKFHFVENIAEVLDIALLKQKVKNPVNFKIDKN